MILKMRDRDRKTSTFLLMIMQCPECESTHINKNGKKKENKTISALIVKDNLLKAMKLKKVTLIQLNVSA